LDRRWLVVYQGGEEKARFALGEGAVDLVLLDATTGRQELALTARLPAAAMDEVPVGAARRATGDDFTMPLPEPTRSEELLTTEESAQARARAAVPNLALQGWAGLSPPPLSRAPGDDLTLGDALAGAEETTGSTEESSDDGSSGGTAARALSPIIGFAPQRPAAPAAAPAELWVRRGGEWTSNGALLPGQRVRAAGGTVALRADGALEVDPGPRLAGAGTLADGRMVEILPAAPPLVLAAGATVLLRAGDTGLYVRTDRRARG
jgi:hypothetical protein